MEFFFGVVIAFTVSLLATLVGFDRERTFYPTVMAVIASYYVLFAVMGGAIETVLLEFTVMVAFIAVAVLGFKRNLWLVVGALFGHGIFDVFHGHFIANPGVPAWWPMFCLSYDFAAALYLSWLLYRARLSVNT
jgi:hypothetical protein